MPKLSDDLRKEIESLNQAFETSIADEIYTPEAFGNGLILLAGNLVRIKVIRDRDQLLIHFARGGPGKNWIRLHDLVASLGIKEAVTPEAPLSNTVALLVSNAPRILEKLSTGSSTSLIESLRQRLFRN